MILHIWAFGGLLLIIIGHKKTEEVRERMFCCTCARFPGSNPDFIMTMVNVSIVVSMLLFIVIWPFFLLIKTFKSVT